MLTVPFAEQCSMYDLREQRATAEYKVFVWGERRDCEIKPPLRFISLRIRKTVLKRVLREPLTENSLAKILKMKYNQA
jgi:hypothetical protein